MIKKAYLLLGILTIVVNDINAQILVSTGSNGDYIISSYPGKFTGYYEGFSVTFKADHPNSSSSATMSIQGFGAKAIINSSGNNLAANDIRQYQVVTLVFDATNDRFQMITTSGNVAPNIFEISSVEGPLTATGAKGPTDILITPLFIPALITVNEMRLYITSAITLPGEVGVYDAAGNLQLNGNIPSAGVGLKMITPFQAGGARRLPAGQYYVAVTWNGAAGNIAGADIAPPPNDPGAIARAGSIAGGGSNLPATIILTNIIDGEYLYAVTLKE